MGGKSRGDGLLATIARMDRAKIFVGALVLALLGLFLPGALGAVLLLAVVAGLAALLSLTWVVTPPAVRLFRLVALAALAAIAAVKLLA